MRSCLGSSGAFLLVLTLTLGVATSHAGAQAFAASKAPPDGTCLFSAGLAVPGGYPGVRAADNRVTEQARLAVPRLSLSCRIVLYVRQFLARDAIAGLASQLQPSLALLLFASAYRGLGTDFDERERRTFLGRTSGAASVLRGFGFSVGRATWAISRVSLSSVLVSMRLSV